MFDNIKLCNCAVCGQLLVSGGKYLDAKPLAGRVKDRPYCDECLEVKETKSGKRSVLIPRRKK